MERFIEKLTADRRLSQRHTLKAGLRVRVRRSDTAERRAESENLSQRGVFFATDLPLSKGASLDLLVEMPEETTGVPAAQWLCTDHVVRIVAMDSPKGHTEWACNSTSTRCHVPNGRSGRRRSDCADRWLR